MFNISAVIFAGGASSRMGRNKALLPFGEYETLAQYQYERLKPLFKKVYISTKTPKQFLFTDNFIIDSHDVSAPTVGLISTIEQLAEERFFVLSVDTPFVRQKEIEKIFSEDSKEPSDATVARVGSKIHPLCGIYHSSMKSELQKMIDEDSHKLQILLGEQNTIYVDFNDEHSFSNLNYLDEYKRALSLI